MEEVEDALITVPVPGELGNVIYTNPATGTSVFVNPTTNLITGVWPGGFVR